MTALQSVTDMGNEPAVQTFGMGDDAFLTQAQALTDGPALMIFLCNPDLDLFQAKLGKGEVNEVTAGPGHNPLALLLLCQPIADLCLLQEEINGVKGSRAHQLSLIEDETDHALHVRIAMQGGGDKMEIVLKLGGLLRPGEPLGEIGPMFIDQGVDLRGLDVIAERELDLLVNGQDKHRAHKKRKKMRSSSGFCLHDRLLNYQVVGIKDLIPLCILDLNMEQGHIDNLTGDGAIAIYYLNFMPYPVGERKEDNDPGGDIAQHGPGGEEGDTNNGKKGGGKD